MASEETGKPGAAEDGALKTEDQARRNDNEPADDPPAKPPPQPPETARPARKLAVVTPSGTPGKPPPTAPLAKGTADDLEVVGSASNSAGVSAGFGFVILALVFWFVAVWPALPDDAPKWIITIIAAAALLAVTILAIVINRARRVPFFKLVRDGISVIAVAVGVVCAALLYTPAARSEVFKFFVIGYFSLLPAFLYLQFMSIRGPTLWEEYTENLFRLHVDDLASLPQPPRHSHFYGEWLAARGGVIDSTSKTVYQKKFEGLFGATAASTDKTGPVLLHTEKLAPVVMATVLFSVAWAIVVMPSPLFELTLFGKTPNGAGSPALPLETLRFGFLGAYFFAVQMLVRRYFQNDLKASAYLNAIMRIVVVALLTWTVDLGLQDKSQTYRSTMAFVIGVFPDVGWKALQALIKLPLRPLVPSLKQLYPLSDLDGLNVWYEARLLEEGIEDMQNLATCNLVDVMLNTRIPVERLVDWVDQSLLYLHLGKPPKKNGTSPREQLRRFGIRTATDLEDAFTPNESVPGDKDRILALERLLAADGEPSVLRTILATLTREPNLAYVRSWRSNERACVEA